MAQPTNKIESTVEKKILLTCNDDKQDNLFILFLSLKKKIKLNSIHVIKNIVDGFEDLVSYEFSQMKGYSRWIGIQLKSILQEVVAEEELQQKNNKNNNNNNNNNNMNNMNNNLSLPYFNDNISTTSTIQQIPPIPPINAIPAPLNTIPVPKNLNLPSISSLSTNEEPLKAKKKTNKELQAQKKIAKENNSIFYNLMTTYVYFLFLRFCVFVK